MCCGAAFPWDRLLHFYYVHCLDMKYTAALRPIHRFAGPDASAEQTIQQDTRGLRHRLPADFIVLSSFFYWRLFCGNKKRE